MDFYFALLYLFQYRKVYNEKRCQDVIITTPSVWSKNDDEMTDFEKRGGEKRKTVLLMVNIINNFFTYFH